LTFEISSPLLYDIGLKAAIEHLAEDIEVYHGISCTIREDMQPKSLDNDIRVLLFQAVRELLTNVVKHANGRRIWVNITRYNHNIKITVRDDGFGTNVPLSVSEKNGLKGFGLFSIRERLYHIGGHMQIESKPGRGTRVTLFAPLTSKRTQKGEAI
jgi:signal transduction histidine kinase